MDPEDNIRAFVLNHQLAVAIFHATEDFPKREWYGGLASQLRRAAYSAAANIVEGRARKGSTAFRPFLDISWSSIGEIGYGLRLSRDCNFLPPSTHDDLRAMWTESSKATWGLLESVSKAAVEEAKARRASNRPSD